MSRVFPDDPVLFGAHHAGRPSIRFAEEQDSSAPYEQQHPIQDEKDLALPGFNNLDTSFIQEGPSSPAKMKKMFMDSGTVRNCLLWLCGIRMPSQMHVDQVMTVGLETFVCSWPPNPSSCERGLLRVQHASTREYGTEILVNHMNRCKKVKTFTSKFTPQYERLHPATAQTNLVWLLGWEVEGTCKTTPIVVAWLCLLPARQV